MVNKLMLDNKNKDTYKVIMKISLNNGEYIIYTLDEKNKFGDKICYVGKYEIDGGIQKLLPVECTDTLESIDEVFRQIMVLLNKKGSSDTNEK